MSLMLNTTLYLGNCDNEMEIENEKINTENAIELLRDKFLNYYIQAKDSVKNDTFVEDRSEFLEDFEDLLQLTEELFIKDLFLQEIDEIEDFNEDDEL